MEGLKLLTSCLIGFLTVIVCSLSVLDLGAVFGGGGGGGGIGAGLGTDWNLCLTC